MMHLFRLSAALKSLRGPLLEMSSGQLITISDRVVALVHEDPQGGDGGDLWALAGFTCLLSVLAGVLASLCIWRGAVLESRHGRVQRFRADFVRFRASDQQPLLGVSPLKY
jgi:hypothetical protein